MNDSCLMERFNYWVNFAEANAKSLTDEQVAYLKETLEMAREMWVGDIAEQAVLYRLEETIRKVEHARQQS